MAALRADRVLLGARQLSGDLECVLVSVPVLILLVGCVTIIVGCVTGCVTIFMGCVTGCVVIFIIAVALKSPEKIEACNKQWQISFEAL